LSFVNLSTPSVLDRLIYRFGFADFRAKAV